ncbi:MAG: cobalt ECF transporter T component CbiQ [Paraclostridium sp.]
MLVIDKCAYTNNLKNMNAAIKLTIAITGLVISMLIKNIYVYATIIALFTFLILVIAKIGLKEYLNCLKIPLYFLILGVGINMINVYMDKGEMIYFINISSIYLGITSISISNSIYLFFRSIACLVCIYFFILTTPVNDLIKILNKIHVPDTLVEIIMLTYRFIFIFLEEVEEIYKSQKLKFGYINIKNTYTSTGLLIKTLFFRMMKRYDDMKISLDIKLYEGKFHI